MASQRSFGLRSLGSAQTVSLGLHFLAKTQIHDFVKCVQKIGKNSIERQGVQLSMYREPNHLNLKLNLVRQLIISSLPQTSVRFFGFKRKSRRILESCHPRLCHKKNRNPDFVKRVI